MLAETDKGFEKYWLATVPLKITRECNFESYHAG